MFAIIFADRSRHGINSLIPEICPALLPIAGKPAIEYTLEELADAGIRQACVFVGPNASELRQLLGQGQRWGITLKFAYSRGDECAMSLLPRLGQTISYPCLSIRGDEIRSHVVRDFLDQTKERPDDVVTGIDNDGQVAITLARKPNAAFAQSLCAPPQEGLALSELTRFRLDTPASVMAANASLVDGSLQGPLRAGIAQGSNLQRGYQTRIRTAQVREAQAYIGDRSEIHPSAQLRGRVVVGADCYIDRDSVLEDCVILPGTYVGAGLHLRNLMASSRGMQQADSNHAVCIDDPLWLSSMQPSNASPISERLLAALLALLCLPLLVLPSGRRSLRGLKLVMRARLRLFGHPHTQTPTATATKPPPRGLISLARLSLPADAPQEEHDITEAVYAEATLAHKLWAALRGLLNRPLRPATADANNGGL